MALDQLYEKVILDHYKNPRNFGELSGDCLVAERDNPVCGDRVKLMLRINRQKEIEKIKFTAKGCALSIASASLMTELVISQPTQTIQSLSNHIVDIFKRKLPAADLQQYGDLAALKGVLEFPVRIKCVLLCWHALQDAIISPSQD